jgi:hypothetical protein
MARKVVDRKELRKQAEAAEAAGATEKKGKKKATPTKRKSRAKAAEPTRKKLFWGVFSPSLKRVALFEFHEQAQALQKAEELSKSGKSPHFVQRVKEDIVEE